MHNVILAAVKTGHLADMIAPCFCNDVLNVATMPALPTYGRSNHMNAHCLHCNEYIEIDRHITINDHQQRSSVDGHMDMHVHMDICTYHFFRGLVVEIAWIRAATGGPEVLA